MERRGCRSRRATGQWGGGQGSEEAARWAHGVEGMRWTAAGQTARGGLFVRWSKERTRVCCRGVGEWSCPSKGRCRPRGGVGAARSFCQAVVVGGVCCWRPRVGFSWLAFAARQARSPFGVLARACVRCRRREVTGGQRNETSTLRAVPCGRTSCVLLREIVLCSRFSFALAAPPAAAWSPLPTRMIRVATYESI